MPSCLLTSPLDWGFHVETVSEGHALLLELFRTLTPTPGRDRREPSLLSKLNPSYLPLRHWELGFIETHKTPQWSAIILILFYFCKTVVMIGERTIPWRLALSFLSQRVSFFSCDDHRSTSLTVPTLASCAWVATSLLLFIPSLVCAGSTSKLVPAWYGVKSPGSNLPERQNQTKYCISALWLVSSFSM